ncbi:hypothetical protein RclHR1_14460001 [Rhizophagus clarus]|uniref:VWFA domain-containing protein n=1 Tax=Rhizophagus clarus TaxID=94130 RepID=A0A2Z6R5D8_9GLOM|nr:hypothetical protein RclHR1_14460001 [Rhizophagus clarus]
MHISNPEQVSENSEFQENIVAGQAVTSMLHSANQPPLTNVDSNAIPEDSVSSTQVTIDPESSSSTIRTENLNNSFIDINTSNNDSFSLSKSQSVSTCFNFMDSNQPEENETVPLNDKNEMSSQFSSFQVDKIIIFKEGLKNLCNDFVQNSFKSISEIDYNQLNSCSLKLIGCYGNHYSIAKFLLNKNVIDNQLYEKLIHSSQQTYNIQEIDNKPRLRPGIYLLMVNPELGLVIHWPEYGCYEDNASSQRKKNMTNLHRYLTKLTDYQICLMSEQDLNSFDWKRDNEEEILNDNDGVCYEFEVKKSQEEQEDFKIFNGFNIILPKIISSEIKNQSILLRPKVIESVSYQAFYTQKIIAPSSKMINYTTSIAKPDFNKEFMNRWGNCSIRIDQSTINMEKLEILVKYGLNIDDMKEQLDQYEEALKDAKKDFVNKKAKEIEEITNDAELFSKLAYKKLNKLYRRFEDDNGEENKSEDANKSENANENGNANRSGNTNKNKESDVNEDERANEAKLFSKYPNLESKLDRALEINTSKWKNLKYGFIFGRYLLNEVKERAPNYKELDINEINAATWHLLYDMLSGYTLSAPLQLYKIKSLLKNHISNFKFTDDKIKEYDNQAKSLANAFPDPQIVDKLFDQEFCPKDPVLRSSIIKLFLDSYNQWKSNQFPNNIKNIKPQWTDVNNYIVKKLNEEHTKKKKDIENNTIEILCALIEEKFPDGQLLKITNITETTAWTNIWNPMCNLTYELDTIQPAQLQITIYETMLEQEDCLKIQEDEFHIPQPNLPARVDGKFSYSFKIDLENELRHISKFDHPKNPKYLVIMWNNKINQMKIYFNTAQNLETSIHNDNSRILRTSKYCLIAVNESKRLIGMYDTNCGVLNVYYFDEDLVNFYPRNSNIQILGWYNNSVPDIKHFLFIKNTEEICFVEKSGRARIYNLVNGQFQAGVSQFPPESAAILCTPDGACIVAFVKEPSLSVNEYKNHTVDLILERKSKNFENEDYNPCLENNEISDNNSSQSQNEIVKAHIYFCTEFGKPASKVIDMPTNMQSLEFYQFSILHKRQIHLTTLDIKHGSFRSVIVKITHEKTQYRFQQRSRIKSLGQVKFEYVTPNNNCNEFIIIGRGTNFIQDVKEGENIVIMGERHKVIEIISEERLKLVGNFSSILDVEPWLDFRIEPKTKLNGLIDSYKLMFEKYPIDSCIDNEQNKSLNLHIILDILSEEADIDEYSTNFEDYVLEMFKDLKRETNKPQKTLKKFLTSVTTLQDFDIENLIKRKKITNYQLGEWIIQLSCLIPIQIAVAKNNQFQPLRDGLSTEDNGHPAELIDGYRPVDSIARNISFGWYEGIFKHFGDRQVKVVSSMGEQSCGKSYLLNHLIGSTFDGSAMRCTEGVWMSLVITKKYIYIALDFEGLRSLERSPQEDLFLTLLNTIVSNLILFKNQFAINRDMSSMFQRFQDGATAKLCIIIKDVPKNDRDDVVREFYSRFEQLVTEEGEDNFITKMYKDGLNIMPWPVFNDADWYKKSLAKVKSILDEQEAKYENARIFLQNIKVIMAKLKVCDWGSLDENLVQNRTATLKRLVHNAVYLGIEQKDEHLMNRDTGRKINDPIISSSELFDNLKEKETELILDSELILYEENTEFVNLSTDLRLFFEDKIQLRKESPNDTEWFNSLEKFFKYIIDRRIIRVQEWFKQNTTRFPQDNNEIVIARYALEQEISKLSLLWTLCGITCHFCGLRCLKNRDHEDDHNCLTDHQCHLNCQFTEAHANNLPIPICSHKAGHEGKHACNETNHLCGEPCYLNEKRNCQNFCAKEIGHEGDNHICQSTRHYCGDPCSLNTRTDKGNYQCPNKCITPHEEEHTKHKCENDSCPIQCPIKDCQRKCPINDHFHAFSDLIVDHFCGNEHQCLNECEQPGICKVHVEPQKQEEVYKGKIQEFTFTKYIQLSEKLKCSKKIPPNKFEHEGPHIHDNFHYCDVKCPFCEYYCTLPYGHPQKHYTRHGNMIQTEFTAENDEFEYKGYKLRVGDKGTFVLCSQVCKELGRHRHIDYCRNQESCKLGNQGKDIQHIDDNISPNPEMKKDYISHHLFWEHPYSSKELQEFSKCDHECRDEIHHKSQGTSNAPSSVKSYCDLQLFHPPLKANSELPNGIGYISLDGHHFTCENPSTREAAFHIILVLDRSSSMGQSDRKPIKNTPIYNRLREKHDNRLGAVYNAVHSFLHTRLQSISNPVAIRVQDTVSIILFNNQVIVPYENQSLTDADAMLNNLLQHSASGGTDYDLAITKAGQLIDTYFDPIKANIIVFLSDGECGVPKSRLNQICKHNQDKKSPLYLYTVLFGSDSTSNQIDFFRIIRNFGNKASDSLKHMAEIAQSYHPQNTSSIALRCQFTHVIDEVNLVNHFTGVAESLRRHKPALLKKNIVLFDS